jgi:transposase
MKESFQPLTDAEWEVIEKLLNDQGQRFYPLGLIIHILFWIVWTGSQCGSPPGREVNRAWGLAWQNADSYFRKWKSNTFLDYLKDALFIHRRIQQEGKVTPSAVAIDSERIKKTSVWTRVLTEINASMVEKDI